MKLSAISLAIALILALPARAEIDAEGYDEHTIRPSHIPKNAPKFEDFPAAIYSGPNAAPNVRSSRRSWQYRTRLKDWARAKPNFAGHYILASWGCGTDCSTITIIDAITGKIYHPTGATFNVAVNIYYSLLRDGDLWHASGAVKFRPDSRLLVLIGNPEEKDENRGISYYVWEADTLTRIRLVRTPRRPAKP